MISPLLSGFFQGLKRSKGKFLGKEGYFVEPNDLELIRLALL
jgi:hypothetical protein